MENKIKFCDVTIGAKFKDRNTYIKTDSVRFINLNYPTNVFQASLFWDDGVNHEVELVTKCVNCKHYNSESNKKKVYVNEYFCDAELKTSNNFLDLHLGHRDVLRKQNPETFSCSFFEIKSLAEDEK